MARPSLDGETKEKIIEMLKSGMKQTVVSSKLGVHKNTVWKISKEIEEKEKDVVKAITVMEGVKDLTVELGFKYNAKERAAILNRAISVADAFKEIDNIVAAGGKDLLQANLLGADYITQKTLFEIQHGKATSKGINEMIIINNNSVKIAGDLKQSIKETALEEIETKKEAANQQKMNFDEVTDVNKAAEVYSEMMK